MSLHQSLLAELKQEAAGTKRMLEKVPTDKFNWKPHEKSFSLGKLAIHVADMINWVHVTINQDELDFANNSYKTPDIETSEQLLAFFEESLANAVNILGNTTDEVLEQNWTMRAGETIYFTLPKKIVLRTFVLNHIVHHRAQLSVYFRLLDIPVPGMYGPTADEG